MSHFHLLINKFLLFSDLIEPSYTFGRDHSSCTVELEESMFGNSTKCYLALSKKHFTIMFDYKQNSAVIEDHSSNGVYLNKIRIEASEGSTLKRNVLKSGTIISLPGGIRGNIFLYNRYCNIFKLECL
jgi:pSer/pThr/pTyr-binding forkhead associated (FHA) protein